ncbi:transporter [Geobacter pelophilus]|uniref:Transporter n=1 Tax=Geoanaerobacter pelophilus TaxID=60036 RepID=A0AAW4KWG2_9BACT|nr:transporter [Geoanaerobacter pelophilus]MBT0663034.1 transporter [Geoanaerobacter pelophilus]
MNLKNSIQIIVSCVLGLVTVLAAPYHVQAEQYIYSVSQGFEFSSGKYGTDTRTDTIFAPLTIFASPTDRLSLSLEIPFVYQSNGNVVSSIARGGMQGGRTTMLSAVGMSGMSGTGSGMSSSSGSMNQSESGLGDITLKVGYILLSEKDSMPQIRPMAFVKFPTADKNKSLGTGEFDEGFAVEITKWLGNWNPFVEAGYTVQGKSTQLALKNYMAYNAGVGYQVADNFRPILLIKGTTPPADGASSLLEVRLKLKFQVTKQTGIDGYIAKGITTNSPDFGTGLSVFYDF